MKHSIVLAIRFLLLFILTFGNLFAQATGDPLKLYSYRATSTTKPNVHDGQIAPSSNPTDWKAAYVRVMNVGINGDSLNSARPFTFLLSNDLTTLYIAGAISLQNTSTLNRLTVYFDQGTRGILEGSPGSPGEYYVTLLADGTPPQDGYWNGSAWQQNSIVAAEGFGLRKGASLFERLYNFELAVPLKRVSDNSNSYLNLNQGDSVGMILKITDNSGNEYFWDQANAIVTDPAATGPNGKTGWAEIVTSGTGVSERTLVSFEANGIVPTIDGNISNDNNWRKSFSKDIVFTDFRGHKKNATLKIKEQAGPDDLLFGIKLDNTTPSSSDYLAIYFDQGNNGRNLNYILNNGGAPMLENEARMRGNGTYQDYHFDGANWVLDANPDGSGAASVVAGNWEVEMRVPLSSGDPEDLDIQSGDSVGVLLHYFDNANGLNYWWNTTINNNIQVTDPINPVVNALGWGMLRTGGPFLQTIYPENGDTLSGEYPLALYALDPNNPNAGILSATYEVRKPNGTSYTTLLSGTLTKVPDGGLPIWTGTLNTRDINQPPGTPLTLVYFVNDGTVGNIELPVDIFVDNYARLNNPSINISSPTPNSVVSGAGVSVSFSVSTNPLLKLDTVEVFVDGALMQTYLPINTASYSNTYSWNTSPLPDGQHIIQVRAINSLKVQNMSPSVLVTTNNTPTISLTSPAPSSVLSGIVNITFTASPVAPDTLVTTQISIDGGSWVNVTAPPASTGGSGSYTWNTALVPDGAHTLKVRTTDNTVRTGYSEITTVMVDNTPATGILSATSAAVKNGDTLTFTFHGSEAGLTVVVPLAQLQLLDNQATTKLNLTDPTNSGVYTSSYFINSTNTVTDGEKTLTATVTDKVNNAYYPKVNVRLDNTSPLFTSLVTIDPDTIYTNGETISLLATFDAPGYNVTCDFSAIDYAFVKGSETVHDNGNGSYSISYIISEKNPRPNGVYSIEVTAKDEVGLIVHGYINLMLDNNGPRVYNLTLTDPDRLLNTNTTITATLIDINSNVKSVEYYVDVIGVAGEGTAMTATDGSFDSTTENVTAALSIATLAEGKHTLFVRGLDVAGKWGPISSIIFFVDRIPPTIELVEIAYPTNQPAARNGQKIVISAQIKEATTQLNLSSILLRASGIDSTSASGIVMVDDGTKGDKVPNDGIYSATLTVTSTNSGFFNCTIDAADIVPNNRQITRTILLDNKAPVFVSLITLDPDTIYRNGETISLLATFDSAGYKVACDFSTIDNTYIHGSEVVTDNGNGTYSIRYTISQMNSRPNLTYLITATAKDEVGWTASGSINLLLDNSGPVVSNLTLADPDRILNTNTTITATLTDVNSNIRAAEYFIDVIGVVGEGTALSATDGNFDALSEDVNALLSIANLTEGKHTLYMRGLDVSGKWGPISKLDFIVDTKPPDIQDVEIIYPQTQTAARNGQKITVTALVTDKTTGVNTSTVMLTAIDVDTTANNTLMYDNGTHGDKVAGDAIYSVEISVNSGKTGITFVYTISAQDSVPNRSQVTGTIALDNMPPQISVVVTPLPKNGTGMSGEVYDNQVVLTGSYFDLPDSNNVKNVTIVVKNANGDNVNNSPISLPPNAERKFSSTIKLVEGDNYLTAIVTDLCGNWSKQDIRLLYIKPTTTKELDASGGSVSSPDGTTITVPANALLSRTEISINTVPTNQLPKPLNNNVKLIGTAHKLGPDGLVFHQQVTIVLTYTNADLDINQDGRNDFQEDKLDVFFWDGNDWIKTAASNRAIANRTVTITTNHFSTYALGTDNSPSTFNMYWTKNPFNPTEGTTAVIDLPGSGSLTLKIYDIAGNLVRTIADKEPVTGATNRKWDGFNDFDNYVGSGIYVYILQFEDNTGTTTVIKKPIGVVK